MLSHKSIWAAIDALARDQGLSVSALAKRAGLDPTAFNKSKRFSRDNKPRWPNTESISKLLHATDKSLQEFVHLIDGSGAPAPPHAALNANSGAPLPCMSLDRIDLDRHFDTDGRPRADRWDDVVLFDQADPFAFALEMTDPAMEPLIRVGDVVVLSTGRTIRRGDRVAVASRQSDRWQQICVREVTRIGHQRLVLKAVNKDYPAMNLDRSDIAWIAMVVWIGQQ